MKYTLRPAWRSQWFLMILAIVLLLIPLLPVIESLRAGTDWHLALNPGLAMLGVPFLIVCLIMIYRHFSYLFTVDGSSIESRHGIIAREVSSIRVEDVRSINVKQSLFQRLLFIGDVEFSSAASPEAEVVFKKISTPMRVKRKIQEMA
ncbi:PH domain-containing protein [candidate division KSB1 bacterium]|nr:PH domain-containing protein [candidate division KSB1 bacterium]